MPSYTTIFGDCDTVAHRSDFDAAVNAVGGAAACVGGQSLGPSSTISQAVNADITEELVAQLEELGIMIMIAFSSPVLPLPFRKPKKKSKTKPRRRR